MKCRHCGFELQEGARFCLTCGRPVEPETGGPGAGERQKTAPPPPAPKVCTVCGEKVHPGARFCFACGEKLLPPDEKRSDGPLPETEAEKAAAAEAELAEFTAALDATMAGLETTDAETGGKAPEAAAAAAAEAGTAPEATNAPESAARLKKLSFPLRLPERAKTEKRPRETGKSPESAAAQAIPDSKPERHSPKGPLPAVGAALKGAAGALKKLPSTVLIGGGVFLAVVLVVAAALLLLRGRTGGGYLFYVESGALSAVDLSHPTAQPAHYGGSSLKEGTAALREDMVQLSSDGKYIAYPANLTEDGAFRLYVQRTGENQEAVRLAGDAVSYRLLDDGGAVYLETDGSLYLADRNGESQRLEQDVLLYDLDAGKKNVIWLTGSAENGFDLLTRPVSLREEKRQVARNFDDYLATEGWEYAAFVGEGGLYVSRNLAEAQRADTGVTVLTVLLPDGTLYYGREPLDRTLDELLTDRLEAEDRQLAEAPPQSADYRMENSVVIDWEAFEAAQDRYEAALGREYLREILRATPLESIASSLWTLDVAGGEKGIQRAAAVLSAERREDGHLAYTVLDLDSGADLEAVYDGFLKEGGNLENALLQTCCYTVFLPEKGSGWRLTPDGKGGQALYTYNPEAGPADGELVDQDVDRIALLDGGDVYYFRADRNDDGTLYKNGARLADDVYMYGLCKAQGGRVWFLTDWDSRDSTGSLCYCEGKRVRVVAENVSDRYLSVTDDGVWYATDLNEERQRFTLGFYQKEPVEVDAAVSAYLPVAGRRAAVLKDFSVRRGEGSLAWFDGKELTTLSQEVSLIFGGEGYRSAGQIETAEDLSAAHGAAPWFLPSGEASGM